MPPAFQDLLAHYKATGDAAYDDWIQTASALSMDLLGHLKEILDETPEKFSITQTTEALKLLADRTSHGPITKSQNLNVNVSVGARLNAARERQRSLE